MKSFIINERNVSGYAGKIAAWIREQTEKAHRKGVVLGMSGGIDCSVVARLCQLAGVDVQLVLLPYGDDMKNTQSLEHAMELINKFHFPFQLFDIQPAVDALIISVNQATIGAAVTTTAVDTLIIPANPGQNNTNLLVLSQANVRPRVRMTYLYQLAQTESRFVIGTGNLSERTVGYFTKWGDGASDLNPLALLTKREIYTLACYLEIPYCIINKKPSAGLWVGQTDEDELGITYAQIDDYILNNTSGNPEVDRKIEARIALSAHKHSPIPIFEG